MSEIHLSDLLATAQDDLRDRWENYRDEFGPSHDEPHDVIHEIADSSVPVYTHQLLRLAADNPELATATPELGPAFDGTPTPVNIIAANLFETIEEALWEEWGRIETAAELAVPQPQSLRADFHAVIADAMKEGETHGRASGSWMIDGNTTEETARRILEGIEAGDPDILDMLPGSPLSGEWADELLPRDILRCYDMDENSPGADDVLDAFEEGFSRGVAEEVERSARALLREDS